MKNVDVCTAEQNRQAEENSQNHLKMLLVCRPFKGFLKLFHSIIGNFMATKTGLTGGAGGIFPSDFLDFHIPGKFSAISVFSSQNFNVSCWVCTNSKLLLVGQGSEPGSPLNT